jgi:hypothetical protein
MGTVNGNAVFPGDFPGQGLPYIGVTRVGHVAVGTFFIFPGEFQEHPVKSRGRLYVGIPYGKIKDLIGAMLFF